MIGIEEVDANEIRLVLRRMKEIEPETNKILKRQLVIELQPIADGIAEHMPDTYPGIPSGFFHNGPTGYRAPKGKVSFTPGRSKRNATNLVSIRMDAGRQRGFYIAELAGSRSRGETRSGRSMVFQLNQIQPMKGKGGRFAYSQFRLQRPAIVEKAERVLNRAFREFERMLTIGN